MSDERKARIERIQRIERIRALEAKAEPTSNLLESTPGGILAGTPILETAQEAGSKALEMAGRTLDMPAGLARVAVRGWQDIPLALSGLPAVSKSDDFTRALQGTAPTSDEYMARQGIEPGVGRTTSGIVQDIFKDPLTYMTLGGSAALKTLPLAEEAGGKLLPRLQNYFNTIKNTEGAANRATIEAIKEQSGMVPRAQDWLSKFTEKRGRQAYKSGLKELDLEAKKFGKEVMPSDILEKQGFSGSAVEGQQAIDDIVGKYMAERDDILRAADEAGGKVDMREAMAPLQEKINQMKADDNPIFRGTVKKMQKEIDDMVGRVNPEYTIPGYSEVSFGVKDAQPTDELIEMHKTSKGAPAIYKKVDLNKQARVGEPFRELGGLPTGSFIQPDKTIAELRFQRSKPALEKIRGPYNDIEKGLINNPEIKVEMGQMRPGKVIPAAPEVGFVPMEYGAIPGKTIPEVFVPERSVRPSLGSSFKSAEYDRLPKASWMPTNMSATAQDLIKTKGRGLKEATETAVGRASGDEALKRLQQLNQESGSLLSSKKKAEILAERETKKNMLTSVDPLAGAAGFIASGPGGALVTFGAKKAADILKTQKARTGAGKFLMDRAKTNQLFEKNLLYTPWTTMDRTFNKPSGETE